MILLILSACISAVLTGMVFKYRPTLGTRSFAALMSAVALWAFVASFEVGSLDPLTKAFSYHFKYLFIVTVPVSWFAFGLYYSNRLQQLKLKYLLMLLALPMVTLVLVATNPLHHLMFTDVELIQTNHNLVYFRHFGAWFWVHASYCYALLLLGFVFLAKSLIDSPRPYRSQVVLLLIGGLTPWVLNMIFIFNLSPLPYLDLTPFAFTVSGVAFMLGIVRYRLLDIVPIARDVIIRNMTDGILVVDNENRVLDLNPAAARMIGRRQNTIIGADARNAIDWWHKIMPDEYGNHNNLQCVIELNLDEIPHSYRASKSPVYCKDKSLGHLVVLHDITKAKMAEVAIRNSEARFRSLTENAPFVIFALDPDGIITYINPSCLQILGFGRDELIGKPFRNFAIENQASPHLEIFERLISGKETLVEVNMYFLHKNGSKRLFNSCAAVNTDIDGRINGIICMAKDITEERRLQLQLFQSQKMEAVGTLAGGIAHDFNNLLMGMQANISLMRLEKGTPPASLEKLTRIENQIQNGASLTRQLLGYARKGKYMVAAINLRRLIDDTLDVVQRTNKNIVIYRRLIEAPTFIDADRGQMELVLLNLFVNAVDAMPDGGDLVVTTHIAEAEDLANHWPDIKPKRYVELKVSDTGIGMDQITMNRIFEPFFTTKEMGQGTGLGLASVYGVVENHDGFIRVSSKLDYGSTFTLVFPL
ncbi:MAG: histidine kinase N-terminal 7TM domain-containing protein, partial [Desulfosarcinaceae bacterium]